jgi:pyruvate-ferredoxin/flavodoxin oxidoreductase
MQTRVTIDGNEAAAHVAYQASEVIAIYPITPASPMGELADAWAQAGRPNLFGSVPAVVEMQSEGGAAGAVHGALQAGALTTTFTASQGLLLMIPNMFKIAGELTPAVFHVAARTVATHALSIFGDHSDVCAARSCGWAMLCSSSVQEAQDMALIAHSATLASRVPFLHFFDGFRTSHEINEIEPLAPELLRAMIDTELVRAHRDRALTPDRPVLRGSAQNPDVFFQAREAVNPFYEATPGIVERAMERFGELTGRRYRAFDYVGAPDAERVIVLMGSGAGAAGEAVEALERRGEKVGLLVVRLFRPFSPAAFARALPESARAVAVLDRTKEPGSIGEPLYQDVVCALVESGREARVIGGRYGLSSKEFTPAMAAAVLAELRAKEPKRHFTIGIHDDVTHMSLRWDADFDCEPDDVTRAVFYGLGSDGTVGANKNSVKIIGESTPLFAQGYFVYDSRKAGAVTVSHLRFSPRPIRSTYLIRRADFVACHQFHFLERMDVLELAGEGATFLLNSPYAPGEVWGRLPLEVQKQILAKGLRLFVVDAHQVASEAGMGGRINTVMQTCFFALSEILPRDEAIEHIKSSIESTYAKRGKTVLERNFAAVDMSLAHLHEVALPAESSSSISRLPPIPEWARRAATHDGGQLPDFVERVTATMLAGHGELLPVSALPVDGTFPTATARYEKRAIAREIPIWDSEICIECGLCPLVCPHAAIRMKSYEPAALGGAPEGFPSRPWSSKELAGRRMTIQVAPDDCTGCGICVDVCPARSKEVAKHKAIDMLPRAEHAERERERFDFFLKIPEIDRRAVKLDTLKGSQLLEPLFEFSGACAGCGETPYLKLLSQLYGDRALIANATGCSSIYGGNLPTTPWTVNAEGRGPAWSNSLFEDNAEFGLGMRLACEQQAGLAARLLGELSGQVEPDLVLACLAISAEGETELADGRARIRELRARLSDLDDPRARELAGLADFLVPKSVWIVGGDGWAYDIGFGGLDHVLASGRDVNVLVLDTGVYSNTGGQASKATPRAAVAKYAAGGKAARKKDLGLLAVSYGSVYVAQIALGANPNQTLRAFREAESYRGPSLIIAYSHCIAHGIEIASSMNHQKEAAASGFWPLFRYDPRLGREGRLPFQLDSRKPKIPFKDFALKEARFVMLARSNPESAQVLMEQAQQDVDEQWHLYEQMAGIKREIEQEAGT